MSYKFTFNVYFYEAKENCILSVSAPDKNTACDKVRAIIDENLDYLFNLLAVEEIKH